MVRTSAPGSAIHTTPSGAPQQTSGNVGVCQDYLNTLIKQAQVQPPQILKNVLDMIQGLIDNKVEPQTFIKKIQVELPSSKQLHSELPYLEQIFLPFLKTNLPGLRQALTANTMPIDGVTAPPVAVIHQEVSMETRVHPSVPPHLSTQHAAAVGGPHIPSSSAHPVGPQQSVTMQPRPQQNVTMQPRPQQNVTMQPRPQQNVTMQPRPQQSVKMQPRPQQSVTIQHPNSIVTERGIPQHTVVTTATPIPSMVRTSAQGSAIHTTPSDKAGASLSNWRTNEVPGELAGLSGTIDVSKQKPQSLIVPDEVKGQQSQPTEQAVRDASPAPSKSSTPSTTPTKIDKVEDTQAKRMAFTKGRSVVEDKDKVAIICKNVPPQFNTNQKVRQHFSKFGKVTRVFRRPETGTTTIHFETHEAALDAKRRGSMIMDGEKRLEIFWSSRSSMKKPLGHKSSTEDTSLSHEPIKRQVQDKAGASLSNWRTNEVPGELAGLSGISDVSKQKPQSLIGPDEVKGQQSQPTEQAVRDASPAPSKSSTPSTTPTKIDKVEDTQAKKMAFARRLSVVEDKDKVAIICKNVPPQFNTNQKLRQHFSKFGKVTRVFRRIETGTTTINFETHEAALDAKRRGSMIMDGEKRLEIFWSSRSSMKKPLGHKSSTEDTSLSHEPIKRQVQDKAGASLSNWRTKEVPGELAGLSGTIDVSKQKPQSLIGPDEVKGQQSQPTEQAVRDASPAPSKSSTPSTMPTKIDKVEDTQAKKMAFARRLSVVEDKDKVAIICKNVPPQFNTNQKLRQHFSKFGKVTRVFRRIETGTTTINFETHEAALDAKRRGSMIMDGEKRLEIFWSSRSSMKKPLGHKSSTEDTSLSHEPIKRQVQDKAGASLSNWRTNEVPGELAGLSGISDVSKQKPQSLIGPDEVKGQQSQPTEQAVRDASPAPSKSSTPSTTPTKIDKVEDTQAKKMAFARRLSVVEDKDKVAIICKNVPPQFNTNQKLRQHFSKFGKVTRVFRRIETGTTTINFETHEAALDAKRRGSMIMDGEKRLEIFWSSRSSMKKPLGHKSSTEDTSLSHEPIKRQVQDKAGASLSNWRTNEVPGELAGLSGISDVSKQKPQSLIGPDEVKGQQSQPTEQAVRDASPAPSKSSTPSTTPTKIDKVEDTQAKKMAFARRLSVVEDKDKVAIICKNVPPQFNTNQKLRQHFSKFGKVTRVFRRIETGTTTINFETHEAALDAKRRGSMIMDGEKRLEIFWSSRSSMKKPLGHKSSTEDTSLSHEPIKRQVQDKAGASLSNWRTKEVPGELAGLSGTIDVSKQKPQSLIGPDEVKGQQSQPTEQAVRDASPAPSKSSTPSTTPTKIDKVEDTQARRMAFARRLSVVEDKDKVAIICKNVPPQFNTNQKLRQHFSKFGKVTRVFRRPERGTATIHFETHEAALDAKRRGSMIIEGEKRLDIVWSFCSPVKKPLGHKSSTEDTSLSHRPMKRQAEVEDTQAKRMAFTKGRSVVEDKDKVAIICKNVPPQFNTNHKLRQHFSKFGKVTRVFPKLKKGWVIIHFETHEAALDAKRLGSMIMEGEQRLDIFWSSHSPGKKLLGHKSSTEDTSLSHEPIKRQAQDSSTRKRVKKTGEEVPSKKRAIEVVGLTPSPKETVTSDVSIPQESQTIKAGTPTTKQQENTREVPCERPDIEMVDLTPSSIETVTSNVSIPQESQTKQDHLSNGKELSGEGSKENYQSSSSVSALEEKSKHKPKKKKNASNSTMEDLHQLKVFYEMEPLEMNTFFEMVKSKDSERRTGRKIEETMKIFKQITEEQLGMFRIDLDDLTETKKQNHQNSKSQKQKVMRLITTSTDEIYDFSQKTVEKKKYKDPRIIGLLTHWTTAVTEFMQNCADVVHSILQPEMLPRLLPSDDEVEEKPCEILYRNLFLSFSRIFLLRPRQQRKVQEKIRKNIVACVSDICFLQSLFQPCTDAPKLVLMCEVKRKEPFKHERPQKTKWIEKKIDPNVMGQIGMELLCESTGSFFSPSVAGIACLRSEIMFLFLDIAKDHHQAIKDDASLDGKHAKIFYTETYDILKPEDRSKFMDILLYFAAIQSCNFIYPL